MGYRFGPFELQPEERRLVREGVVVPLARRAFDVLVALVERPGELVTKDELIARVWPKLVVEESNLQVQISSLRRAIGAEAIETVPGSGYRLRAAVRRDCPPATDAPRPRKHNLPHTLTSYVTSEGDIESLAQLLDGTRLLTVAGAAGLGKTRACQQLARANLDHYEDGVWLVELAPVAEAALIPQAVAAALGIQDTASGDPVEIVRQYVKDRRMLLLLDNCEHLLQGCSQFARLLLEASPHLKLLASSREVLHLSGETTVFMKPLRTPDDGHASTPQQLLRYEAVRLFVDRATAVLPTFELDAGNAPAVARICTQLDGIPLAIELAAVQVRALSVATIAQRLADRFRLLKTSDRTVPARHRTLEATIAWSYDLLSGEEAELLARLSIFAGGWTIQGAEFVADADGAAPPAVVDVLARLVEKSLVVFDPDADRYRMLETIRQYGLARLASSGRVDRMRSRHASYVVGLAQAAEERLFGPSEDMCHEELGNERNNIRAAYRWLLESGETAATIDVFFRLRRWFCSNPFELIEADLSRAISMSPPRDLARCKGLFTAAFCEYYAGRYADARDHAQQSYESAHRLGDVERAADALTFVGSASHALGDLAAAETRLRQGVDLARAAGNPQVLLDALNSIAELHSSLEQFDAATMAYQEALELAQRQGSGDFATVLCINLARVALSQRDVARCARLLGEAMAMVDVASITRKKMHALLQVCAGLATARGESPWAARIAGVAQGLIDDMGQRAEPADERVLAPLREQSRYALGAAAYDAAFSAGRVETANLVLPEVREWLHRGPM